MNKVFLIGRLVKDPEITYAQNDNKTAIGKFTVAVDRRFKRDGEQNADFIQCSSFGKTTEFAEKYLRKGSKVAISGRWQTGSYTNKDGHRVYTNTCVVEDVEFCESKATAQQSHTQNAPQAAPQKADESFMDLPEGELSELPFK